MECFNEIKKIADKVKMIEKHLENCFSDITKDERPTSKDCRTQRMEKH